MDIRITIALVTSTSALMKETRILWPIPMPGLKNLEEMATFQITAGITVIAPSEVHLAWEKPSKCHALTIAEKEDPPNIHWSSARICKKWRNEEVQKALHGGHRGGGPGLGGNPGNRPPLHENSGPGNGGNDQNRDGRVGFQQNPKQLGRYHIHTIHATKRDRKLVQRVVNTVSTAVPRYLKWSEYPITWSREDHPPAVEHPGLLALVVAPQVGSYVLNKVLMDGGSSINILYYETFLHMGLKDSQLQPTSTIFHGIVPGKLARPEGRIRLEVAFGESKDKYRSEMLMFEVVKLQSPYHALFGRPAFASFMARPCYVYL